MFDSDLSDYSPAFDYEDYLESIDKYSMLNLDDWLLLSNNSYLSPSAIQQDSEDILHTENSYQNLSSDKDKTRVRKSFHSEKLHITVFDSNSTSDPNDESTKLQLTENANGPEIEAILPVSSRFESRSIPGLPNSVTLPAAFSVDPHNGTVFVMLVSVCVYEKVCCDESRIIYNMYLHDAERN